MKRDGRRGTGVGQRAVGEVEQASLEVPQLEPVEDRGEVARREAGEGGDVLRVAGPKPPR